MKAKMICRCTYVWTHTAAYLTAAYLDVLTVVEPTCTTTLTAVWMITGSVSTAAREKVKACVWSQTAAYLGVIIVCQPTTTLTAVWMITGSVSTAAREKVKA